MRYWEHGVGFGWGWFGLVTMVVLVALLAALGTLLFVLLRGAGPVGRRGARHGANEILDERFARGEIDEEELAHRRAALERPAR